VVGIAGKTCTVGQVVIGFDQNGDPLCVAGGSPRPNLLINGDFENPILADNTYQTITQMPGWQLSYGSGFDLISISEPYHFEGRQSVELDGNENSGIQQTVSTTPNKPYQLSVYYAPRPAAYVGQYTVITSVVEVYFNGQLLASLSSPDLELAYKRYIWTVTPTTSTSTIEFRAGGTSDSAGGEIDYAQFVPLFD